MDVRGVNDASFGLTGGDPGGSCYLQGRSWEPLAAGGDEVDGGGLQDAGVESDGLVADFEEVGDFLGRPWFKVIVAGDARVEGSVTAEFECS